VWFNLINSPGFHKSAVFWWLPPPNSGCWSSRHLRQIQDHIERLVAVVVKVKLFYCVPVDAAIGGVLGVDRGRGRIRRGGVTAQTEVELYGPGGQIEAACISEQQAYCLMMTNITLEYDIK